MTETDFISEIDCAFPYENEAAGLELARKAFQISANACFMVGEELSRPPMSVPAPAEIRLRVLALLRGGFAHPLRDKVLDVAELRICGASIRVDGALALLREISDYRHQYCAMNIVYFACDDVDGRVDAECERIRAEWDAP